MARKCVWKNSGSPKRKFGSKLGLRRSEKFSIRSKVFLFTSNFGSPWVIVESARRELYPTSRAPLGFCVKVGHGVFYKHPNKTVYGSFTPNFRLFSFVLSSRQLPYGCKSIFFSMN